jgi:hypothetical protein
MTDKRSGCDASYPRAYGDAVVHGPLDFFDTLAQLDWSGRFESFSAAELRMLRRFDELAADLGRRSFFATPQRLAVKAGPDESYERLEHAGEDALRSMAMSFRRLQLHDEPARFEPVLKLLLDHLSPDDPRGYTHGLLTHLGRRYRQARRTELMKQVWEDDPFGEPIRVVRAQRVIDDWFNAGPFHGDEQKSQRVAAWSPVAYEWSFVKAVHGIAAVIWELHVIVMLLLEELLTQERR